MERRHVAIRDGVARNWDDTRSVFTEMPNGLSVSAAAASSSGPDVVVGDFQEIAVGIVKVEGESQGPFDLLDDRDSLIGEVGLPVLVLVRRHHEAGVHRACGPMRWQRVSLERFPGLKNRMWPDCSSDPV